MKRVRGVPLWFLLFMLLLIQQHSYLSLGRAAVCYLRCYPSMLLEYCVDDPECYFTSSISFFSLALFATRKGLNVRAMFCFLISKRYSNLSYFHSSTTMSSDVFSTAVHSAAIMLAIMLAIITSFPFS